MASINANFAGSGFIALKDTNGNSYPIGLIESATLDSTSEIQELMGANKMPAMVIDTGRKVKLSVKFAQYSSALLNVWMSGTTATGSRWISTKAKTAAASTFTVATADDGTPAGWAFVSDLGVVYTATGQPLKYNSGTLAAGEYKNTAGAYTLHGDDATANVTVTYLWSQTAGERTTFANSAIGISTYYTAYVQQMTTQPGGTVRKVLWEFPAVLLPSLKMDFSNANFLSQSIDLDVMCDASGVFAYQSAV